MIANNTLHTACKTPISLYLINVTDVSLCDMRHVAMLNSNKSLQQRRHQWAKRLCLSVGRYEDRQSNPPVSKILSMLYIPVSREKYVEVVFLCKGK